MELIRSKITAEGYKDPNDLTVWEKWGGFWRNPTENGLLEVLRAAAERGDGWDLNRVKEIMDDKSLEYVHPRTAVARKNTLSVLAQGYRNAAKAADRKAISAAYSSPHTYGSCVQAEARQEYLKTAKKIECELAKLK